MITLFFPTLASLIFAKHLLNSRFTFPLFPQHPLIFPRHPSFSCASPFFSTMSPYLPTTRLLIFSLNKSIWWQIPHLHVDNCNISWNPFMSYPLTYCKGIKQKKINYMLIIDKMKKQKMGDWKKDTRRRRFKKIAMHFNY